MGRDSRTGNKILGEKNEKRVTGRGGGQCKEVCENELRGN